MRRDTAGLKSRVFWDLMRPEPKGSGYLIVHGRGEADPSRSSG